MRLVAYHSCGCIPGLGLLEGLGHPIPGCKAEDLPPHPVPLQRLGANQVEAVVVCGQMRIQSSSLASATSPPSITACWQHLRMLYPHALWHSCFYFPTWQMDVGPSWFGVLHSSWLWARHHAHCRTSRNPGDCLMEREPLCGPRSVKALERDI